tara:strand:+ start:141 stop:581 length:441 start_codon:yes stop_codon:yes gene_type:complete
MASIFICRISPKSGAAATAVDDFQRFRHEIDVYGSGIWDNTSKNAMKVGDMIGFITGHDCEETTFYRMTTALPLETRQENRWNTTAYSNTATEDVSHREVIRLSPLTEVGVKDWKVLRTSLGYSPNYVPRGATRMKNVPFSSLTVP